MSALLGAGEASVLARIRSASAPLVLLLTLAVRPLLLVFAGEETSVPEAEARGLASLGVLLIVVAVTTAFAFDRDLRRPVRMAAASGSRGFVTLTGGHVVGLAATILSLALLASLVDVLVLDARYPAREGLLPRELLGTWSVASDQGPADGKTGIVWLRSGGPGTTLTLDEELVDRGASALLVDLRPRISLSPFLGDRSLTLLVVVRSDFDGRELNRETLTVRDRGPRRIELPAGLGRSAVQIELAAGGGRGSIGLQEGQVRVLGRSVPRGQTYVLAALRIGLNALLVGLLAASLAAAFGGLIAVVLSFALVLLRWLRDVISEGLGPSGLDPDQVAGRVAQVQVAILDIVSRALPSMGYLAPGDLLADRTQLPVGHLAGEAGVLALYAVSVFGIGWFFFLLREDR